MKRLFVFGCSYTAYGAYPTWADFLGLEFDKYENWAISGLGNRGIAERVAECYARNNFTKDDIVVVQWSSHLRHDFFNPKKILGRALNWKTYGSIFSPLNAPLYDRNWYENFFFEPAYVMHSLNNMVQTQALLKSTGCKWYMTSIGDWPKLGADLEHSSSDYHAPDYKILGIKEQWPEFKFYLKKIWDEHSDHWLQPMALHANEIPELAWWFEPPDEVPVWKEATRKGKLYKEPHPSPRQHASWLNTNLRPLLGLGDPPEDQELWLKELDFAKEQTKTIQQLDGLLRTKHIHSHGYVPPARCWPPYVHGL